MCVQLVTTSLQSPVFICNVTHRSNVVVSLFFDLDMDEVTSCVDQFLSAFSCCLWACEFFLQNSPTTFSDFLRIL